MNEEKRGIKPSVYLGLLVFLGVIVIMIFVMAPVQGYFGMLGLAITEVGLFLCGLIPALAFRWNLKEIFALKLPQIRQIFGVIVLWIGSYLFVMVATLILGYFFPEELYGRSSELNTIISSIPFVLSFLITAVMPAVCEETLHRGLILHTFKNVKNKWITIVSMGVIFGVFHLDPIRFLPTCLLGMSLTYIMLETKNILLPMLFHFVNNALPMIVAFNTSVSTADTEVATQALEESTIAIGVYCILGVVIPFALLLGSRLIHTKEENKQNPLRTKTILITCLCSAAFFIVGAVLMVYGILHTDLSQFGIDPETIELIEKSV